MFSIGNPVTEIGAFKVLSGAQQYVELAASEFKENHKVKTPLVIIPQAIWEGLMHVLKKNVQCEFAAFLKLRPYLGTDNWLIVEDLLFPKQSVSSASVDIDGAEAQKQIEEQGWQSKQRFICHFHSHCSFGAYWSATDLNQQHSHSDLGFMDDYRFYIVANSREELTCCLVVYHPFYQRYEDVPVLLLRSTGDITDSVTDELDAMYAENVTQQACVSPAAPVTKKSGSWKDDYLPWWDVLPDDVPRPLPDDIVPYMFDGLGSPLPDDIGQQLPDGIVNTLPDDIPPWGALPDDIKPGDLPKGDK